MIRRRPFLTALTTAPLTRIAAGAEPPIRIGQIGTKHAHAAGKLATIRKFPDLFELVGVVEPDPEQRDRVADRAPYEGVDWIPEPALLERDDVQAIAVETEVRELVPTALRCIRAGKHIHLDKPGGTSLGPFAELLEEADARRLTVQMGYMFRYNPAFEFLFQAVRDGWLGPIREIHGVIGKKASASLRRELAEFPGGGMFELACHLIDALVTVTGPPDEVTPFQRRSHPETDAFLDNQVAVFEYPGALATIRCNHVDPFGFVRRQVEVVGEQGAIEIEPLEPPQLRLFLDRPRGKFDKGIHSISLPKPSGRYDGDFRDLAAVLRGTKALAWDSTHDLAVQRAVLLASGMPL